MEDTVLKSQNKINAVFITDNNYVLQTYITMMSIYENKAQNSFYDIYVISMDVTDENIKILKQFECDSFKVNILNVSEKQIDCNNNEYIRKMYSPAILLKMQLEKILPELDKVLFLDSDLIITKDLSELYNTDISKHYIAGVKDILPTILQYQDNNKLYENYINVGVMLLNLDLIRQDKFFERAYEYFMKYGEKFSCPEQDTINDIIGDKVKIIHPKYNWITTNPRYTAKQLLKFYNLSSKKETDDKNIVIYHYAGLKPWKYVSVYYDKLWNSYFKKSPFKNTKFKKSFKYTIFTTLYTFIRTQYRIARNKKFYKKIKLC